jgi:glycerol kinase
MSAWILAISQETTGTAALLVGAGLAVGFWSGEAERAGYWQEERRFLPQMDEVPLAGGRCKGVTGARPL